MHQAACKPVNEEQRLKALSEYRILGSKPEEVYDNITRIAALACNVPIALISLVDRERQWFKSRVGLDAQETPREHAFCAHAIYGDQVMVVEDASQDARFADNPLVTGAPNIRFYAGAPLITRDGHALGTLCVIGDEPRTISAQETRVLEALAQQAMTLLEYRRVSRDLSEALSQVKVLSGLIPICAWCKQVRDDDGYWHEVDRYIATQTGADITHGICPQCLPTKARGD